jgi:hypothetical protein
MICTPWVAYFHVRDGVAYPAVLFTTGANDPRVAPWEMTKMAARVQAATSSGRPVLLRIDYDAGHGIGSTASQGESLTADCGRSRCGRWVSAQDPEPGVSAQYRFFAPIGRFKRLAP